ncbi:MAG: hypothetical protein PHP65_06815, partial [Bacilli bacterium]|nr:hypothetical protein [Bacilli bacterium]
MNKTDLYYDFFDQIAMLLVEHKKLNYLEAFYETTKILCDEGYDCKVDQEVVESMEEILKAFFSEVFSQEDIRLALELLTIKAFKDTNQSLDFMTPDSVNYILSRVINRKFYQNDLKILDLNLGTSNLLQAIANNFPNETELFGIESNKDVVQ